MQRRELLRIFAAAAAAPVLSPELFALLRQAHPAGSYSLRAFTPHQNDTVIAMAEIILPATDTPGASAARVNEFMDFILADWATEHERVHFLTSLDNIDTQCVPLFGKTFLDSSLLQQTTLLRSLDDAIDWLHESDRLRDGAFPNSRDTQLHGDFFRVFKYMTLYGYYTSEIGFTQELKLEIMPGAFRGCDQIPEGKKG
ncbi:MAG TPA: gluconate 2-dehydrogenase subunit 3 family protein [Candidatus Acidoferrum sp.]